MAMPIITSTSFKCASKPQSEDMLIVGGFTCVENWREGEQNCACSDQWTRSAGFPEPRDHYAVAVMDCKLFLVGGSDPRICRKNSAATNTVFMYNMAEREWYKMADMNQCRMHHAVCVVCGMLYVIGGQDERRRVLCSVECLNLRTNTWCYVTPMGTPRCGMAVTVYDASIFVAGGFGKCLDKTSRLPVLDEMEIYCTRSNRWTDACRMCLPRCYANLVTVCNNLYLCGGATYRWGACDNAPLCSVSSIERYDPCDDRWEPCTDLFTPRHDAGAVVIGTKIYIMGGVSSDQCDILQSIECFDTTTHTWDRSVRQLPFPATGVGCVSLSVRRY